MHGWWVLAFAITAQLRALLDARLAGTWTRKDAYCLDKLGRQLAEIDKALRRSPKPAR